MSVLYMGMGSPYVIRAVIPKSLDFDPAQAAAATAVAFVVTKPTKLVVEWPATVKTSLLTSTSITIEYALATIDLDVRGSWRLWARFTLANGDVLRTNAVALPQVFDRNQIAP